MCVCVCVCVCVKKKNSAKVKIIFWRSWSDLLFLFPVILFMSVSRPALRLTPCECLCPVDVRWRTSRFCAGPSLWTKRAIANCQDLPLDQKVTTKNISRSVFSSVTPHYTGHRATAKQDLGVQVSAGIHDALMWYRVSKYQVTLSAHCLYRYLKHQVTVLTAICANSPMLLNLWFCRVCRNQPALGSGAFFFLFFPWLSTCYDLIFCCDTNQFNLI